MISQVLGDIATGLGTLVPAFFKALLDGFTNLFVATSESSVKLTAVGEIAIVFIVIGMVYKIAPTVVGWLRLSMAKRRRKKSRAK